MLTRPMTVDSDTRGRGLVAGTVPPALPLADEGVFSPPVPPWSSSSSSSCTPPPPPPCASSSSSDSSVIPPLSFLSSPSLAAPPFCPPPASLLSSLASVSPPISPSLHSSASSTPPPPSLFSPLSSSRNMSPSRPPQPPAPLCVSSSPPFPSSSSTPSVSVIPDPSSAPSLPSSSFHPSPPSLLSLHSGRTPLPLASSSVSSSPLPPTSTCVSPPFSCSRASFSSFVSPPAPAFFTPCVPYPSALCSPFPPSSPPVHPSYLSSPLPPPTAPSLYSPATTPCCPCTTLLPRLLSAHRSEMRRLLRGALTSLGRRLDSLERRCGRKVRKKRSRPRGGEEGGACSPGSAVFPSNSASSCSPAHQPPVMFSSSSDSEDTPTPPDSSSLSQSQQKMTSREEEEEGGGRRKRKRRNCRGREMSVSPENSAEEEEVDSGRFVGRMVVSVRGGDEQREAPLTLHNFNNRKQRRREGGRTNQSEKAISVVGRNGYRVPLLSLSNSSSQNALHLFRSAQLGQTCSQSNALILSSGQWRFSDFITPLTLSSNHSAFHLWLQSSSFSPAPMLRLSAVTVETISESIMGGASGRPLRPLKDWTAPPSLSSDHCYMRTPTASQTYFARRQQKQRANHSSRRLHLPRRRPLPLCSANGVSAQLPMSQSAAASEFLSTNRERGKRVSQIRIRRASPRETPLTPMGLPKVKRLKKKEFSLEEIYTNKNYKSPTTNRSLETIFEEPREKDGALLLIGQQRRRRILLFPDFTQPRKRKKLQGAGLPVAMVPRKRTAARRHCHGGGTDDDESDLDVMLVERLSALEDFLTRQGLDM